VSAGKLMSGPGYLQTIAQRWVRTLPAALRSAVLTPPMPPANSSSKREQKQTCGNADGTPAVQQTQYDWLSVLGTVCPAAGQSVGLLSPRRSTAIVNRFLQQSVAEINPNVHVLMI
jgi:hypothetical protein